MYVYKCHLRAKTISAHDVDSSLIDDGEKQGLSRIFLFQTCFMAAYGKIEDV